MSPVTLPGGQSRRLILQAQQEDTAESMRRQTGQIIPGRRLAKNRHHAAADILRHPTGSDEVRLPVDIAQIRNGDPLTGRGMDKLVVTDIDADMAKVFARLEEH